MQKKMQNSVESRGITNIGLQPKPIHTENNSTNKCMQLNR